MDRTFKAVYLLGVLAQIVIRMPYERQRRRTSFAVEHVDTTERVLVGLLFVGSFFVPVAYIFTPWLNRANYRMSDRTKRRSGGIGTALLVVALWLFWRAHHDLGQNWSPSLQVRQEHELVTRGVYRSIRHPMYASQWVWSAAQALLLQNWIAGLTGVVVFAPLYLVRVPREERMMIEQFGPAYERYMQRTGRVAPSPRLASLGTPLPAPQRSVGRWGRGRG